MATSKKPPLGAITIEGIVTPAEWDPEHNVAAVAIVDENHSEYRVADRGLGEDLFGLVSERVKVRGTLGDGRVLLVEHYRVLELAAPEE